MSPISAAGPSVPAGLQTICSTSDPLQPGPADPGLHGLLPSTCDPPYLLVLPSASPGRPSIACLKPVCSCGGQQSRESAGWRGLGGRLRLKEDRVGRGLPVFRFRKRGGGASVDWKGSWVGPI